MNIAPTPEQPVIVTKEHPGPWFTRVWHDPERSLFVRYEVLEVAGCDEDDAPTFIVRGGDLDSHEETTDHNSARAALYGEIKWDGCSHNYFFPYVDGYHHACDRASLVALGEVFAYLYDEAACIFKTAGVHTEDGALE